jgi:hypothetical protein
LNQIDADLKTLFMGPDPKAIVISIRLRRRYPVSHRFQRTINAMLPD